MGQQATGLASGWTEREHIRLVVPTDAEQPARNRASRHAIASPYPALITPGGICA